MNTQRLAQAISLVGAIVAHGAAYAAAYGEIYVLGDSLSDVGNRLQTDATVTMPPFTQPVPDSPYAYGGGRYSNGPVWVEYLARHYGLSVSPSEIGAGNGYAYGAARTGTLPGIADNGIPTLVDQAGQLLADTGTLSANALIVVWGGANDVRDAGVLAGAGNFAGAGAVLMSSLNNIGTVIGTLAAHGGQNFLVPNLPDLAITPAAIAGGPAVRFGAHQLSTAFNQGLGQVLPALSSGLGVRIDELNVFSFANAIVANPAQFGFVNVTQGCAFEASGLGCGNPEQYAFWDAIHPTTAFHAALAQSAVPLPAAFWLFGTALIGVSLRQRRTAV